MQLNILENYEQMSQATAQTIIECVMKKPKSLLCLAGGHTPLRTFELLVEAAQNQQVDFRQCHFVSLDEWVGLGKDTAGSCKETLYHTLFDPLSIREEQICFFDGLTSDLATESQRIDSFIHQHQQIDLILLGVGMNGHLGFNEPNVNPDLYSHIVDLDPITKQVSSKYFDTKLEVKQGITLGMKHIFEAGNILLIANNVKKSAIVQQTVEGEITTKIPSTLLQNHPNVHVFLDQAAASKLERRK
ncbi:glucosamine-6-phosphate deaminase [Shimazuella kribbensis]|uniref:glucosamine-6-phosphate deaminase n=1 Tax=Shimazuella kribbensis TaxID=139808 RepID=UPI0003FE6728|nr:glucosamine-6-phosphate deaminase [Shimazuella kribbensis]